MSAPRAKRDVGADDRVLAVLAHLAAPIAAVISLGTLSILGPLVIWLLFRNRPLVRSAAAGAFNFNVSFWVLYVLSWALIFTLVGAVVGVPLLVVIFVVSFTMHGVAALRSANGHSFDYPFQIHILS